MERCGIFCHESAFLIASIVQDQGDGFTREAGCQRGEQQAHACGIDVSFVGDGEDLFGHGIHRCEHIEALASGRRSDKEAFKSPNFGQAGTQDEMGRIDEENMALSGFGVGQTGFQLFCFELFLLHLLLRFGYMAWNKTNFAAFHPQPLQKGLDLAR